MKIVNETARADDPQPHSGRGTVPACENRVYVGDARTYPDWVVGAAESRKVDPEFPQPGATLHHTQGIPRIGLKDTSTVVMSSEVTWPSPFVTEQVWLGSLGCALIVTA